MGNFEGNILLFFFLGGGAFLVGLFTSILVGILESVLLYMFQAFLVGIFASILWVISRAIFGFLGSVWGRSLF